MAATKSRTATRLAARYIDPDLVLSDSHAWTYLRLPVSAYEFVAYDARKNLAHDIHLALGGLVSGTEPIDAQIIVTSREVNVDFWAQDLADRSQQWHPAPGWSKYLGEMAQHLKRDSFRRKEVYLGICLGLRNQRGTGKTVLGSLIAPIQRLLKRTEAAMGMEDHAVPAQELAHFRKKAKAVQASLRTSYLKAVPAHPNAVAWLITKPLYPAMPVPAPSVSPNRVWGPGEIQALAEGRIDNGHRSVRIEQVDPATGAPVVGFTTTLALSRFPDVLTFPDQEPWMHYTGTLPFPVDISSRLLLVPALKVQKDVKRRLQSVKDQAEHVASSGGMVPMDLQKEYGRATDLEFTVNEDRQPWAYGRHRITVTAPTQDILDRRVQQVIDHYRELRIDVVLPSGDQFDLLCEFQPGDRVRSTAYYQRQELMMIAGGMPTASAEVGDQIDEKGRGWVGPYIGDTTSRVRTIVHFSPHVAMAKNYPGGFAIIGAPGGGKSFFAFTLAYQMAMEGVWVIYIDPKADAIPMGSLPGLGSPKVFDLAHGADGMLDPFSLADKKEQAILLALDTVRLLVGGNLSEAREAALFAAVERVAAQPRPSLNKVVEDLENQPEDAARGLGALLRVIRGLDFARLCFAEQQGAPIRPEDGLTVITLLGLQLPTDAKVEQKDYSYDNRLAVAVMYLLSRYARRLMLSLDKNHPKAIVIDEAWVMTATPQGKSLIPEIARMGRSHNTALGLVTQNAGDLMEEGVTNSISSIFAFRSKDPKEVSNVLNFLRIDDNEGNYRTISDLNNGECLMRDVDGRYGRVQIDGWNADMKNAFDTNPITRGSHAEGKQPALAGHGASDREWSA